MAPKKGAGKRKAEAEVAEDDKQQEQNDAAPEKTPPKKRGRGRPAKNAAAATTTTKKAATAAPKNKKTKEVEEEADATQSNGDEEDATGNGNENGKHDDGEQESATSIYDFTVKDIKGNEVKLDKYKGHVLLIVNVASRCGYTSKNYKEMVELYNACEPQGLRILAFPCNQFGKQEPATNEKICEFAEKRGVKFDMFEKIDVNGSKAHPLYKYLKQQIAGPNGADIKWNFVKFIVDKSGKVVERHPSPANPLKLKENLEDYF
ncbi:hypothetical protein QAD02_019437 [Eretmocerus hayati]|uniref:Uncharacterized protein n=1 Tax=Eretmocerus hayati TaxID=131215 RepID=A0ACC2PJP0_9HYME|nr:hypothetical protein QAD02_019437 [Eretmocerus hayati]